MYVYPGQLGNSAKEVPQKVLAVAIRTGQTAFTFWNRSRPIVAFPDSRLRDVSIAFDNTLSMQSLGTHQVLAQIILPVDEQLEPIAAATNLLDEANFAGHPVAYRFNGVLMWASLASTPMQILEAWTRALNYARQRNWMNVELPQPEYSGIGVVTNDSEAACILYWLRWESGVEVAEGPFGNIRLRVTSTTPIRDVLDQARRHPRRR